MEPGRIRFIFSGYVALLACLGMGCGPRLRGARQANLDSALVRERDRRIAAFDSVVKTIDTDSSFKLWHAMLTAPDIRKAQLAMMCENSRLSYRYGQAAFTAMNRMLDTLWKRDDPKLVDRMDQRLVGESPLIGRDTCGDRTEPPAPTWLRKWYVPVLPALPPSPDSLR